jgi:hypothetical protein
LPGHSNFGVYRTLAAVLTPEATLPVAHVADALARYFQGLGFYMEYLDLPDDALLYAIRQAVRWQ